MEYEIDDDPQGEPDIPDYNDDGEVTKKHRALRNQSSVTPGDYSPRDRAMHIPEQSPGS